MKKNEVVVVSGVRTAIGGYGGSLKGSRTTDMATAVISEAVKRSGIDSEKFHHCVMGNVIHTESVDMYLSRLAAIQAGLPEAMPALTLNRLCGSGLQAVISAAQQIELGQAIVAVAGGAESMSRAPYHIPRRDLGNAWVMEK